MRVTVIYDNHAGYRKGPLGAHGFSVFVEVDGTGVLVDTGADGEVLLGNMEKLGVSPGEIDYVFLTHGHYDHTGGLKALLEARRNPVEVIAHPEIFRHRIAIKPFRRNIGMPFTREELEDAGARFVLKREPFEFAPGIWSSGEIPRRTWDRAVGYIEENGNLVRDTVPDDVALIIDSGEESVVITGCGHSGVLNIVQHARNLLDRPVGVLMGGLHLLGVGRELLDDIVNNPPAGKIYAGHCTGVDSYAYLKSRLGDGMGLLHVGRSFEI
nr:MBL fold metallo-hydrolase [Thermococcus sp.]